MHVGIATQTPDGLKVPVVRNAQSLGLWEVAAEIRRLAERARANKATREELVGSTITVTSLGKLGGIASTPIINAPVINGGRIFVSTHDIGRHHSGPMM